MPYSFRPFRLEDAEDLADLTVAAIRAVGSQRYSPKQVEAWAARHPSPKRFIERARKGDWIWLAVNSVDKAVAYALLEEAPEHAGHLDMLYCHPDHTRKGLADALLTRAEIHAKECANVRLFTEASELARASFERAGYKIVERRDFEIEGTAIHNYAMEKHLN